MLVGSVLGLLAFLLAVTMTMASDRFDTRRALVLEETNSIGTTYLRAGFLDEPYAGDIRELLREYVPLRITVNDRDPVSRQPGGVDRHPQPDLEARPRRSPGLTRSRRP